MNELKERQPPALPSSPEAFNRAGLRRLALGGAVLAICFARPLYALVRLSLQNDLYSHVLLIPCVSLYLVWIKRSSLPPPSTPNRTIAASLLFLGAIILTVFWSLAKPGSDFVEENYLASRILPFLFFFAALSAWILGRATLRALMFPLVFLIFMVPFPATVRDGMETFLQYGSAGAARLFFNSFGTPVFYHDLVFRLPGINLQVAPECSGIRSSLALFITSVVAGHFFLRSRWKCAVLSLAVIPLALLRNGFRIFTIGELCVHISPDMINSYIHRQGGPVFFALSLIPFFLLLWLLLRSEQRPRSPNPTTRS